MSELIRFYVKGCPVPKQSFRMGNGHGYTPAHVKAWSACVQAEAMRYIQDRIEGDVYVKMFFYMPDKRRVDLENLCKNINDSIQNICFGDDSRVTKLLLTKSVCKDNPGVLIAISEDGGSE